MAPRAASVRAAELAKTARGERGIVVLDARVGAAQAWSARTRVGEGDTWIDVTEAVQFFVRQTSSSSSPSASSVLRLPAGPRASVLGFADPRVEAYMHDLGSRAHATLAPLHLFVVVAVGGRVQEVVVTDREELVVE
jgi:hypothetical protein